MIITGRTIPLRIFLLFLLLWAIVTVYFGWAVKSAVIGTLEVNDSNNLALKIASFPNTVMGALTELEGYTSGTYEDDHIRIGREISPSRVQINVDLNINASK